MIRLPAAVAANLDGGARREWIEPDGIGGFAMGTACGAATRRYHAILCAATRPPVGRMVLVNGLEEEVQLGGARFPLSTHFYPGVIHPHGHTWIEEFRLDPWPTWVYRLGGLRLVRTLFVSHAACATVVSWRLHEAGEQRARLIVRPLLTGRDYHSL